MASTTISSLAQTLGPTIVGLRSGSHGGSGVVVDPGVAVTLARNVHRAGAVLRIGDVELEATVLGIDPAVDLAVLAFEPTGGPAATWGASEELALGSDVYALADPGGRGLRATAGTVSTEPFGLRGPGGRLIEGAIEHTAPLPRGSGGGPLLDGEGRIVGLNAVRRDEGLIVAWPAAALRERATVLASGSAPKPARLGIEWVDGRAARRMRAAVGLEPVDGLLVRGVERGSAAAAAGLKRGDVIVAVDGQSLAEPEPLFVALEQSGERALDLSVVRGEQQLTLTARVGGEQ
jgi:serine protease Do